MIKISYTAFGRDHKRCTNFNPDQVRFVLTAICPTVYNLVISNPLHPQSRIRYKFPMLEEDVIYMTEHIPELARVHMYQNLK